MAMDYGSSFPGDMATLAENAASATMAQVQSVWTNLTTAQAYAKIAVTPMIGVNDDSAETFTLADAAPWPPGRRPRAWPGSRCGPPPATASAPAAPRLRLGDLLFGGRVGRRVRQGAGPVLRLG
jgi:hypothetical protein